MGHRSFVLPPPPTPFIVTKSKYSLIRIDDFITFFYKWILFIHWFHSNKCRYNLITIHSCFLSRLAADPFNLYSPSFFEDIPDYLEGYARSNLLKLVGDEPSSWCNNDPPISYSYIQVVLIVKLRSTRKPFLHTCNFLIRTIMHRSWAFDCRFKKGVIYILLVQNK